jgi:type IV pilus assembly protein PilB
VVLADETIGEFLRSTALFRGIDAPIIERNAPHLLAMEHDAGTPIVRAGAPEAPFGLLMSGRATIRQLHATTGATILEDVRPGDFFGEAAALLGSAQTHEVHADEASTVLTIPREVLGQLVGRVAPFAHAVARRMAMRSLQASAVLLRTPPGPTPPPPGGPPPAAPSPITASGSRLGVGVGLGDHAPLTDDVLRLVRIASYQLEDKLVSLLPGRAIAQHRLLPLELRGRVLTVGMVDPFNQLSINELRRLLPGTELSVVGITADELNETIVRLRLDPGCARTSSATTPPESLSFDVVTDEPAGKIVNAIGDEVVQLANRIIATAIDRQASDIHIEGDSAGVRVRFRVQGALHDWEQAVTPSFARGLLARLKVLAGVDITERRLPQDGRIGVRIGRRDVDLRVSTMPTLRGEKIVMRLFEAATMTRPLDVIFLEPKVLGLVRAALARPYGAVIVGGPTGSGKSSTLYACLHERRRTRPDTNILTVEDPVEYRIAGCTQVQVNHAVDLGFASILRGFLRQDPDVIMVGEVRDPATATLALEAAMTGHLLFTSLHANNAVASLQRLENLGCTRPLIAQSVALVLVQRLARRLCPKCVKTELPPPVMLESLAARGLVERGTPIALPRPVGCADCGGTGYAGRVAVIEALELRDSSRNLLMAGVPLGDVEKQAAESGALMPFRRYASLLMARNLISPSEALLVVT